MAGVSVKITLNQGQVNAMLAQTVVPATRKAGERTVMRARNNLAAKGRRRTGRLSASINAKVISANPHLPMVEVGSYLDYAIYQERGIGPVHAKPGRVLRFQPKGGGAFIFRPRTRGFSGAFFLRDAARQISVDDFL
jgi:hypothetical protein